MRISIITCFHNSVGLLPGYFRAIESLDLSGIESELILVDNASRDETPAKLNESAARLTMPHLVTAEMRPGLMYARCRAMEVATGDYAVFFDDDNEPRPDYVRAFVRLIERFPNAVAFTGNATLPAEYAVPKGLGRAVAMLALRSVTGEREFAMDRYCPQPAPWGAGLGVKVAAMRAACAAWLKTSQTVVGRTGNQPIGGEEIWLVHHMTKSGESVVFSETLSLTHRINPTRLTPEYLSRLGFEYGAIQPVLVDAVRTFKPSVKFLYRDGLLGIAVAFGRMLLALARFCVRPNGENLAFASGRLGLLLSLLRRHQKSRADD